MAKAKSKSKPAKTVSKAAPDAAAGADIDDIFAAPQPKAGHTSAATSISDKKKKSSVGTGKDKHVADVESAAKKKDKRTKAEKGGKKEKTAKKTSNDDERPESKVVEVVDPSAQIATAVLSAKHAEGSRKRGKEVEEDKAFRDSRGDVNRKRTEEGYYVFKEAELGIDPEAGGTPLCPFDCDCCF